MITHSLIRFSRIGSIDESSTIFWTQAKFLGKSTVNDVSSARRGSSVVAMARDRARGDLTFEVAVPNRQTKFRELIILIAEESREDSNFGATKLNKLMWRADFTQFFRTGVPITGAKYQRLPAGPAPQALLPVKRELIDEGALEEELHPVGGYTRRRLIARRRPDLSVFTDSELELVRSLVRENWGKTAKTMSLDSHGLAWNTCQDGDLIPYEAEYISDEPPTPHDIDRTRALVAELGLPDGI